MAEDAVKEEKPTESPFIENETEGFETASYRKCRGQFCLTSTENHFEYEIALDFSPFTESLTNYSSATYERIDSLTRQDHSIDRVKSFNQKQAYDMRRFMFILFKTCANDK